MRKNLLVILAVAVLGLLGVYGYTQKDETPIGSASSLLGGQSYHDGTFAGDEAETPYGPIQIKVLISGGKIVDVQYIKMPKDDARSTEITTFSKPALKANTLKAQSADIDFVSGATSTSYGYQQSLQEALDKAAGSAFVPNSSSG